MLIGDAALQSAFEDPTPHYDLGKMWLERTGLPMVFAVFAAPEPVASGMAALEDALVDSVRRAGLDLTCRSTGEPYDLAPLPDLTAYRVVQESLTNAVKHGTGSAELVVDHGAEGLCIEVRNPVGGTTTASSGGGHGLIGMRERVEAVRGRLTAGPGPDGYFTVSALIPRRSA